MKPASRMARPFVAAWMAAVLLVCGCDGRPPGSQAVQRQAARVRIVSLSPAISRTLVDFGLDDSVVGRTPFCESLDRSVPVVGDLVNINYELLVRMNPTHVLVQPPSSGLDEHLAALAAEHGWTLGQWRLNSVDDVSQLVRELPITLFDGDPQRLAQAARRAADLLNDIAQALSPGAIRSFRGRVLLVSSVNPVMAYGRGTYLHDVLIGLGATNAVTGAGWVSLAMEDVVRMDPQAIVIVKPSARHEAVEQAAGALLGAQVEAVAAGRVALLSHPDSLLPSTGVVGVANELREILQSMGEAAP